MRDGRSFRVLTLIDEFTRECLAIDVSRKLNHDDVLERLSWLMATRGVPEYIRSDNGSEFTAKAVRAWLKQVGVKTLFITPGSPWDNGYIESFNGKLADELLEREVFDTLHEAKVLTFDLIVNDDRPDPGKPGRCAIKQDAWYVRCGAAAVAHTLKRWCRLLPPAKACRSERSLSDKRLYRQEIWLREAIPRSCVSPLSAA